LLKTIKEKASSANIIGVLIEEMKQPSTELIVGGLRDSQFGPSIMLGIGGVFTEVYNDVTFRVAPINKMDAIQMLEELKGTKILKGFRGTPAADIEAIIELLIKVSDLMIAHYSIDQLDLNPVIAYPKGITVVDARIIIKTSRE
jgi:acetyl-CoA synthetase (ADP-forming)